MNRVTPALLAVLLVLLLAGVVHAQTGGYDLSWRTVDGGGGFLSNGAYTLHGTIGQPDAGALRGGDYTLQGGFWGGAAVNLRAIYLPVVLRGL